MAVWHELYNGTCAIERARPLSLRPAVTFVRRGFCFPQGGGAGSSSIFVGLVSLRRRLEPRQAIAVQSGS